MSLIREIESLSRGLEKHHAVFWEIYSLCRFSYTKRIPTAGILFDKEGAALECIINQDFWNSLDDETKRFGLCHEMLHAILEHGKRWSKIKNKQKANIAADICINEALVDSFGFERKTINNQENFCWLDTVPFVEGEVIQKHREFEYYYNRIDGKALSKFGDGEGPQTFDIHFDLDSDEFKEFLKDAIANSNLTNEEVNDFQKKFGLLPGSEELIAKNNKIKRRQQWRKIILPLVKSDEIPEETWVSKNRRYQLLKPSFFLPHEREVEEKRTKADVWLFLDTSGSCQHIAQDLFDAAKTIPEKFADVRLFGFDTNVYEIKDNQLKGFGGTSFVCIEQYLAKQRKYPQYVFVFTDGEGDSCSVKHPKRWHWFLTADGLMRYLPSGSSYYRLDSLEKI